MKRKGLTALVLCLLLAVQPICVWGLDYTGSASYASGPYYTALCGVTRTGDKRADIVSIAQSQIGYQEGDSSSQLSGEVKGSANYTEYGRWYGLQDMWCAMFVSWCACNAGVPTSVVPRHSFTVSGLNQFISWGRAYTRAEVAAGTYTPQPGDVIYFKSARNQNKTNHVGLVTGYADGSVYTIEGNTSSAAISTNGGAVCAKSYSISNTYIVYICCPNYAETAVTPQPTGDVYFPACSASCTTVTQGLQEIGADASYANRKVIAAANGIADYSGTAAQNEQMLALLKAGRLIDPDGEPETPQYAYFPACGASYTSLAPALDSVGADSTYANRKRIAAANGIAEYSGTAAQNEQMLALLKAGKLIDPDGEPETPQSDCFPACGASYTTLAAALESVGADASYAYRQQIAAANNISNYSGTAAQNTQLLTLLKSGTLVIPSASGDSACGCGSAYTEHITLPETCTEDGAEYDRCSKCGVVSNLVTIPATGHEFVHTQIPATCVEAGADVYTCLCGETYSVPVAPIGHSFDLTIAENVTVANGAKSVRCIRCDERLVNLPGDTNADGGVDLKDVVALQRVLAGWDVPADRCNADVNADGKTDLKDAVLIARCIAGGWNVVLQFSL